MNHEKYQRVNFCEIAENNIKENKGAGLFLSSRTRNNNIPDHARSNSEIEYQGQKRALPHNQYQFLNRKIYPGKMSKIL